MKLTTHVHRVSKLRMSGAVPSLSYVLLCCGSLFSTGNLPTSNMYSKVKVKVKLFRYRPGQALGVPGG